MGRKWKNIIVFFLIQLVNSSRVFQIDCKPFKTQFEGKWKLLISKVTKCVVKLIEIAQNRRRNYVLDQVKFSLFTQLNESLLLNFTYKIFIINSIEKNYICFIFNVVQLDTFFILSSCKITTFFYYWISEIDIIQKICTSNAFGSLQNELVTLNN